jgi:hypothetical protein
MSRRRRRASVHLIARRDNQSAIAKYPRRRELYRHFGGRAKNSLAELLTTPMNNLDAQIAIKERRVVREASIRALDGDKR